MERTVDVDFLSIGSVNNYVKSIDMNKRWNQRKETGEYTVKKDSYASEWVAKQAEVVKSLRMQQDNISDSSKLSYIQNKLANGSKLTHSEKLYLKEKDPVAYQRATTIEAECAVYEKALKSCKTKDEAHKLKITHLSSSISTINSVKNDSNIPDSQKIKILSEQQQKMARLNNITIKFIKQGEMSKLPTQVEHNIAEKKLKEAKKDERESRNVNFICDIHPKSELTDRFKDLLSKYDKDSDRKKRIAVDQAELDPKVMKLKRSKRKSGNTNLKVRDLVVSIPVSVNKVDIVI